jgi:hypothetical protein
MQLDKIARKSGKIDDIRFRNGASARSADIID